jgi:hypothetical protein
MWAHLQDYRQANRQVRNVLKKKRIASFQLLDHICAGEFMFTAKRDVRFFFSPMSVKGLPSLIQDTCPEFFIFSPTGILTDEAVVGNSREFLARINWPSLASGVTGTSLFVYGGFSEVLALEKFLTSRLRLVRFYIYNKNRLRRYIFNRYIECPNKIIFFGPVVAKKLFYLVFIPYFLAVKVFVYLLMQKA